MINRYETSNGEDIITGDPNAVSGITPMPVQDMEIYVDIINGFTSNNGSYDFPLSSVDEALKMVAARTGGYIDKDVHINIFSIGFHPITLGRYYTDDEQFKFNFWGPGSIEFLSLYTGPLDYTGGSEGWGTFMSLDCQNINCRVKLRKIGLIGQAKFRNMRDVELESIGLMTDLQAIDKSFVTMINCIVRNTIVAKSKSTIRIQHSASGSGSYDNHNPRFHAKDGGQIYIDWDGGAHNPEGTDLQQTNGQVVTLIDNWKG